MRDLTEYGHRQIDNLARRHGISSDAALTVLRALAAGGGGMAQFSHPEFGGMSQWSQGGMVMIGDMFNHGLKHRVDALCHDLANLLRDPSCFAPTASSQGQAHNEVGRPHSGTALPSSAWWPAELGTPSASGGQNDMRYAYFPEAGRLAVQQGSRIGVYDTASHRITGVSQQQGNGEPVVFSGDAGKVRLRDLQQLNLNAEAQPKSFMADADPAPSTSGRTGDTTAPTDLVALIERLAELHARGVLTDEEFSSKKAELLGRL